MDRTGLLNGPPEIVVDATRLEFADHRNLLVLHRMADRYGRTVVLRTARSWPGRLVAALDLTRLQVQQAGGTAPDRDHRSTLCDERRLDSLAQH